MSKGNSHKKNQQLSKDKITRLGRQTTDRQASQYLADFRDRRLKDSEKHPSIVNTINISFDNHAIKRNWFR